MITNKSKITLACPTTGMGDILVLTSVAKHIPNSIVQLQTNISHFSRFFQGICSQIIITDNILPTPEIGQGHHAVRKLRYFGLESKCHMPLVLFSEEELNKGISMIKNYENPIAFVGNSSVMWKHEREPSHQYLQNLIDKLCEQGHTVLQFGISKNLTQFKRTIPIVDLDINNLICYYAAIKKYVGVDTGDTHLMLALGGSCEIYIPNFGARIPELWNYNSTKAKYYYFNKND